MHEFQIGQEVLIRDFNEDTRVPHALHEVTIRKLLIGQRVRITNIITRPPGDKYAEWVYYLDKGDLNHRWPGFVFEPILSGLKGLTARYRKDAHG